jgi:hypothetical protein
MSCMDAHCNCSGTQRVAALGTPQLPKVSVDAHRKCGIDGSAAPCMPHVFQGQRAWKKKWPLSHSQHSCRMLATAFLMPSCMDAHGNCSGIHWAGALCTPQLSKGSVHTATAEFTGQLPRACPTCLNDVMHGCTLQPQWHPRGSCPGHAAISKGQRGCIQPLWHSRHSCPMHASCFPRPACMDAHGQCGIHSAAAACLPHLS